MLINIPVPMRNLCPKRVQSGAEPGRISVTVCIALKPCSFQWLPGSDSTRCENKSDCIDVYEKMTSLLVYYLCKHFLNELMVLVAKLKSLLIWYDVHFVNMV